MKKSISKQKIHGVGRRKSAVARVWLSSGKGVITVNGREYQNYFDTVITQEMVQQPLKISGLGSQFNIDVNVNGGGRLGQAGAVRLGLSRALLASDETLRPLLKRHKLLHCDARIKERKKYGQRGARRKFQFVKR